MEWTTLRDFGIALLIGALVGAERESHKRAEDPSGNSGLRTFILLAMAGAVSAWIGARTGTPWIFVATLAVAGAGQIASYVTHGGQRPKSSGLTTEAAALCVCLLGGMTMLGYPELAVGLGIVTTAILAYKDPMHGWVTRLGRDDIYAGLRLLFASFIVLPLLPDRTVDPWNALNPYKLWLLVILISALSLVGYVAVRWLGPGRGTALTGLTGGVVSSTAVTLSFARGDRDSGRADSGDLFALGILIAWGVMFPRVMVEVAVVHPPLLSGLAPPFIAMGLAAFGAAAFFHRRSLRSRTAGGATSRGVPLKNPFSLTRAVSFGLVFALVLVTVSIVRERFSAGGLYLVSFLAGLTDVDAITLSMADFARTGGGRETAVAAITLAALANTFVKCAFVLLFSGRGLKRRVLPATLVIAAAGGAALCFA
ncbi:MAG: MgtC/SapB family protein [Acidobacteria bacterium]|nr:MgtC/SapB family protein [Acidobacteriota bacterium]